MLALSRQDCNVFVYFRRSKRIFTVAGMVLGKQSALLMGLMTEAIVKVGPHLRQNHND